MKLNVIKQEGKYCFGAGKYVSKGRKKVFETIEGVEIWKHMGHYYWIQDGIAIRMGIGR